MGARRGLWSTLTILSWLVVLTATTLSGCASDTAVDSREPVPVTTGTTAEARMTTSTTAPAPSSTTTTQQSVAELLLEGMTVEQKALQVMVVGFTGTSVTPELQAMLAERAPGGVLLLGRNVGSATELRVLIDGLQEAVDEAGAPRLLVAVDQEGGPVQRIHDGAPDLPAAREVAESSTPEDAGTLAAETARSLLTLGVNVNLAPVADVVDDEDSFLFSRSYGSDPSVVSAYVRAVVEGQSLAGVISVPKHFPGHGSADGNTHGEAVIAPIDLQTFSDIHLPPFLAAIDTGAEAIMISHVIAEAYDPERPASSSRAVIQDLLRGVLGFEGVVVADDIRMAAATSTSADPAFYAVAALQAGCDLLISTGTRDMQDAAVAAIVEAVGDGTLVEARLDEAVLRVLELKVCHGIIATGRE